MGPEYAAIFLTAVISAITGGSWVANKLLSRQTERIQRGVEHINTQRRRIDNLEDEVKRLPMDYVLKVDFLHEITEMHSNFRQINNKLDKLIEKLLAK